MIPPETVPVEYRKLPGKGRRAGAFLSSAESHRLWLGPNHLLLVQTTFGVEEYKRFYFADIQALTIKRNARNPGLPIAAAVALLASAAVALAGAPFAARVVSWVAAAALLAALGIYRWQGPGCRCYLRTAVQVQELFSLRRWRSARRVLEILQPVIEAAQGALTSEFIEFAARAPAVASSTPSWRPIPGPTTTPLIRPYRSVVHSLFFATLVALGLEQAVFLASPAKVWLWLELPLYPLSIGCAVLSLVRQRGTDLHPRVRGVAWAGAGYIGGMMALGYVSAVITGARHPEANFDIVRRIELAASSPPEPGSFSFALSGVLAAAALLLGLGGLALRFRPARPAGTASNEAQP